MPMTSHPHSLSIMPNLAMDSPVQIFIAKLVAKSVHTRCPSPSKNSFVGSGEKLFFVSHHLNAPKKMSGVTSCYPPIPLLSPLLIIILQGINLHPEEEEE